MENKEQCSELRAAFIEQLGLLNLKPDIYRKVFSAANEWARTCFKLGIDEALPHDDTTPLTIMEQQNPECPLHGCHVAGEHHKVKHKVFGEVEAEAYKIPFAGNAEQFKVADDWSKELVSSKPMTNAEAAIRIETKLSEIAKIIQSTAPTPKYPSGSNTPTNMTTVGEHGQEVVMPPQYTAVAEVCKSHNLSVSEDNGVLLVAPIKP